jgi:RNA polymerase sigma-70 factor (ECF subfamily)
LIARSRDGDVEAYRQLLKEIEPFLKSQAAQFHRNPHDIEDAVQDAMLSIHSVRHAHDAARPFGPWLVAIARRRFTDRLRRQGRIRLHEVALDPEHDNVAAPFEDSHERRADARIVRDAVAKLPPAQREAIMLTKLEELSLDEAARVSGSSVGALKISTHRGLRGLQKLLAPHRDATSQAKPAFGPFEPTAISALISPQVVDDRVDAEAA